MIEEISQFKTNFNDVEDFGRLLAKNITSDYESEILVLGISEFNCKLII